MVDGDIDKGGLKMDGQREWSLTPESMNSGCCWSRTDSTVVITSL